MQIRLFKEANRISILIACCIFIDGKLHSRYLLSLSYIFY